MGWLECHILQASFFKLFFHNDNWKKDNFWMELNQKRFFILSGKNFYGTSSYLNINYLIFTIAIMSYLTYSSIFKQNLSSFRT